MTLCRLRAALIAVFFSVSGGPVNTVIKHPVDDYSVMRGCNPQAIASNVGMKLFRTCLHGIDHIFNQRSRTIRDWSNDVVAMINSAFELCCLAGNIWSSQT